MPLGFGNKYCVKTVKDFLCLEVSPIDFYAGEAIKPLRNWPKRELVSELLRVQELGALALPRPGQMPVLPNIDYHAILEPSRGCVGGDHLAIVDFDRVGLGHLMHRAQERGDTGLAASLASNHDSFGILIADVAGHGIADNMTVTWLHAAFEIGISYELEFKGKITADLFSRLNEGLYERGQADFLKHKPYVTMLYGEIRNNGGFRYMLAGHPKPRIFSHRFNRLMHLDEASSKSSTPLGILPPEFFAESGLLEVPENEIQLLGAGDILVLHTDGVNELEDGKCDFFEERLEEILRDVKDCRAEDICRFLREELHAYCVPDDDYTMVVIKKKG